MGLQVRPINFGITGREFQEVFDVDKYIALAYLQPKGALLQEQVEEHWEEWCRIVAEAPWLKYWKRSKFISEPCVSPADVHVPVIGCGIVPLTIFSAAVWGFGIDGWLRVPDRVFKPLSRDTAGRGPVNPALTEILRLQGAKSTKTVRKYMWDDRLYRGCGIQLPPEFGELDRWLQPVWERVCTSSK